MKICEYCGSENEKGPTCISCGGPLGKKEHRENEYYKSEPFFWNGYVIWALRDYFRDTVSYYFYLGNELVETIELSIEIIRMFVPEGVDAMSFIWDLFKVAQGEEEVLKVQEQNSKKPSLFEIKHIQTEQEQYYSGLTMDDIYQAMAEHKAL